MKRGKFHFSSFVFIIFSILFIYFIYQPAIYSFDSFSYLRGDFNRYPGYVIFARIYTIVFGAFFDYAVISTQLLLGFTSIYIFLRKISSVIKIHFLLKVLLFSILIFPYFPHLSIANNIASEGLAYPFYLLLIAFSFNLIFQNQHKKIIHISIFFVLLTLTRGQFIIVPLIVAFIYLLKHKKKVLKRLKIYVIFLLIILPFINQLTNKTYNKIIYGHFVTTPFSYINVVALPLFVSNEDDANYIDNEEDKLIFLKSYHQIDSLGLLSSKIKGDNKNKYQVFHDNFPIICNQNIFQNGIDFYNEKYGRIEQNSIRIEKTCKAIFPVLLKRNFKNYIVIYFEGVFHGFHSIIIAILMLLVLIYSFWLCIKNFTAENGILLLSSLLIVSNSLLVALACHSISRYLFYNYALGFLIVLLLFRKIANSR